MSVVFNYGPVGPFNVKRKPHNGSSKTNINKFLIVFYLFRFFFANPLYEGLMAINLMLQGSKRKEI